MDRDALAEYEQQERRRTRERGRAAAPLGTVTNVRAIYDDLHLPDTYAFHRSRAPVPALCFFYPATVLFLPPTTPDLLRARIGMDIDSLIELSNKGILKPLIGHPTDYADLPHFDSILRLRPPSVWARGDELAHQFAYAADYWREARKNLPLKLLTKVPWVRAKWKRQFPHLEGRKLTERIEIELCTNYVDLCIFGYEEQALATLRAASPSLVARQLVGLNEVLTYPKLIGVEGTPHYGITDRRTIELARSTSMQLDYLKALPRAAPLVLDHLNLALPGNVTADAILAFHKDGLSKRLWGALACLEEEINGNERSAHRVADTSAVVQELLISAEREIRGITYETARKNVTELVSVGVKTTSILAIVAATHHAGFQAWQSILAGFSATSFFARVKPFEQKWASFEEALTDWWMSKKISPLATHLWWVDKWKDNQGIK